MKKSASCPSLSASKPAVTTTVDGCGAAGAILPEIHRPRRCCRTNTRQQNFLPLSRSAPFLFPISAAIASPLDTDYYRETLLARASSDALRYAPTSRVAWCYLTEDEEASWASCVSTAPDIHHPYDEEEHNRASDTSRRRRRREHMLQKGGKATALLLDVY